MLNKCYSASFTFKYSIIYLSYVIKQNSAIVVRTHSQLIRLHHLQSVSGIILHCKIEQWFIFLL